MDRVNDKELRANDEVDVEENDSEETVEVRPKTEKNPRGAGRPKGAGHSLRTQLSRSDTRMTVLRYTLEHAIKDYENNHLKKTPKEKLDLRNNIDKIYQEIELEREKEKIAKEEEQDSSEKLAIEFWEQMIAGVQSIQNTIEKRVKE